MPWHASGGNPWVLTSGCLAELLYRAAAEIRASNGVTPSTEAAWHKTLDVLRYNTTLIRAGSASDLAQALATTGDGVLLRIRYHTVGSGLHMPEQLDRNTGVETSATDLTWSYATILKAMAKRSAAFGI